MAEDEKVTSGAGNGGGGEGSGGGEVAQPEREPQREVLSLSQLIGAPIHALVDAEAQSAMATARFIRNVGFKSLGDAETSDFGDLQMARFRTIQRGEDGQEQSVEVQIPLLTLLPIPALQIQDATLEYIVKVIQTESLPEARAEASRALGEGTQLPIEAPATMRATFASEPRPGGRRSMDMLVKMKVRIEQADMPAGLARLLNLASESVSRVPLPADNEASEERSGPAPPSDE